MKKRAFWGGMAAAVGAMLALGACGNPIARLTTERAIGNAVSKEFAQPGLNLQISLAVTPGQLLRINQIEHGDSSFTPRVASALSRTSLVVNVYPGHGESLQSKQFASDPNNQYQVALQVGGAKLVEVRYLNDLLYARADVTKLLSDFGAPPPTASKVHSELRQGDQFVHGLSALGEGDWVSANLNALAPMLKPGASNSSNAPASEPNVSKLLSDLKSALTSNTSYANLGTHGGRTEYQLKVPARDFVRALKSTLPSDLAGIAGGTGVPGVGSVASQASKALNQAQTEIPPGQTIAIQLWVKDNKAQEVDLDINQFVHKFPFAVPLRFVLAGGTPVTAPSGVTSLDFPSVSGLLGGLMGGSLTPS
jgi:hypothetical protein